MRLWSALTLVSACVLSLLAEAQDSLPEVSSKPEPRRPGQFAIIFQMGYAGDALPQDRDAFDKLIAAVKAAHYNTVLCKYEPWRAEICQTHGVQIMVDLLAPGHHVYKEPDAAKSLCQSLLASDAVYGYHLWSDEIGGTAAGRNRDAAHVRMWDPRHPTYVGTRNARGLDALAGVDLVGYYDFHWQRGGHFRHLARALEAAQMHDARLLEYCQGDPGLVGKGNYNRVLYTISTSLAFGLKGYLFHYTGGEIDPQSWKWQPLGEDLARVNTETAPLGPEVLRLGNPTAVYSTPVTRTEKDDLLEGDKPTPHPELTAIPADFWLQIDAGESLFGVYQDEANRDVLIFANHNAYQPQAMQLRFATPVKRVEKFDRLATKWVELSLTDGHATFDLPPAAAELVRVKRQSP